MVESAKPAKPAKPAAFDDFVCHVCGKPTDTAPRLPARSVCPACCEDHDYRYEPDYGFHVCLQLAEARDCERDLVAAAQDREFAKQGLL